MDHAETQRRRDLKRDRACEEDAFLGRIVADDGKILFWAGDIGDRGVFWIGMASDERGMGIALIKNRLLKMDFIVKTISILVFMVSLGLSPLCAGEERSVEKSEPIVGILELAKIIQKMDWDRLELLWQFSGGIIIGRVHKLSSSTKKGSG